MKRELVRKISGPPGTGKSTTLLNAVDELLKSGVAPEAVVFTTFTRAGANEARDRACARFKLPQQSFPYFRTLHSLCYQFLPSCDVMTAMDWCVIAKKLGVHFTLKFSTEEGIPRGHTKGDYLLSLWALGRVNLQTPEQAFAGRHGFSTSLPELTFDEFDHFIRSVEAYKQEAGKMDYTDMLEKFLRAGEEVPARFVIIDEAQDLSALQWEVVRKICRHAEVIWVAGDDDQCIHEWNGASPRSFIDLEYSEHRVLPQSYRIPSSVHKLANEIIQKVTVRIPKEYKAREEPGLVDRIADLESVDLRSGSWLLLARNQIYLREYAELCRRRGILFTGAGFKTHDAASLTAVNAWKAIQEGKTISQENAIAMYQLMSQRDRIKWGFKKQLSMDRQQKVFTHAILAEKFGLMAGKDMPWTQALDMMPPEEMAYLSAVERREGLGKPARVEISTIHGAKGKEADHVVLRTDMTQRTFDSYQSMPDPEHRVWYVGVTRARQTLQILPATAEQSYPL
jgi:DNA helicase-2/ATP-dependent DNA helicase PcrA